MPDEIPEWALPAAIGALATAGIVALALYYRRVRARKKLDAAIGAVAEAGRSDLKIVSSYENQAMLDALNRGDILAFATQYPVGEGAIAIDQAVRLIEKKPVMSLVQPVATVIDKTSAPKLQMDLVLAPASWTPVYSVKAK